MALTIIGLFCLLPTLFVSKNQVNPFMQMLRYVVALQRFSHLLYKISRIWKRFGLKSHRKGKENIIIVKGSLHFYWFKIIKNIFNFMQQLSSLNSWRKFLWSSIIFKGLRLLGFKSQVYNNYSFFIFISLVRNSSNIENISIRKATSKLSI